MNYQLADILSQVAKLPPSVSEAPVVKKKRQLLLRDYQEIHTQLLTNILAGIPGRDQTGLEYFRKQTGQPELTIEELPDDIPDVTIPAFPFCVDTSNMGLGKTFSTGGLALGFNARFLVIGLPSIEYKPWRQFVDEYELPEFIDFLSYNMLAGTESKDTTSSYTARIRKPGSQCTVPLLIRRTVTEKVLKSGKKREIKNTYPEFTVTEAFKKLVGPPQPGDKHSCTFIVFDEFHSLKNLSARTRAASAMARYVLDHARTSCRLIYLSATPFDAEKHATFVCYGMGIMKSPILYDTVEGVTYPQGMGDLIRLCERPEYRYKMREHVTAGQNPVYDATREILQSVGYGPNGEGFDWTRKSKNLIYRLMTEIVFEKISSAMPPLDIPVMLYRGFFSISNPDRVNNVFDGFDLIHSAIGTEEKTSNDLNATQKGIFDGRITRGLVQIEKGCVIAMCDYVFERVKQARSEGKMWKGVLGLNYMDNLREAYDYLTDRGGEVIVYAGQDINGTPTPPRLRSGTVDKFQGDDTIEFMLVTIASGGTGISFHDTDPRSTEENGGRKRIVVATPDYKFTAIHQFFGRFNRNGSRSVAECYLFYPNVTRMTENGLVSSVELDTILDSLSKKSRVTNSTLYWASRGLIKFPGNYPRYIEGAGYIDEERAQFQVIDSNKEPMYEDVPRLDEEERPFFAIYLTSNEDADFGTFIVHEAVNSEGGRFDTSGRPLDQSGYFCIPGDNTRVYRVHQDGNDMAIFVITDGAKESSFESPIHQLSNDEMNAVKGMLRPLIEFNRNEDKDKVPLMRETPTVELVRNIRDGFWDDVPLMQQQLLFPDWEKIREIDRLEAEMKSEGAGSSSQSSKLPRCPEYGLIPPGSSKDPGHQHIPTGFNMSLLSSSSFQVPKPQITQPVTTLPPITLPQLITLPQPIVLPQPAPSPILLNQTIQPITLPSQPIVLPQTITPPNIFNQAVQPIVLPPLSSQAPTSSNIFSGFKPASHF